MQPRIITRAYADVTTAVRKKSHQECNMDNIQCVDSREEVNKAPEEREG